MDKKEIKSEKQLYYEIALFINQQLYDEAVITFNVFKNTQAMLLKQLQKELEIK